VDFETGTLRIRRTFSEVRGQGLILGPPKSRASIRTVSVPAAIMADLTTHVDKYVSEGPEAYIFTGPKGIPIRRGNFNPLTKWMDQVAVIGAEGVHFHDLRHTGNMLAAAAGGSTRDLMARMGHDSMNAALIYQHATAQADKHIADQLDAQVRVTQNTSTRG
jgi:integrase